MRNKQRPLFESSIIANIQQKIIPQDPIQTLKEFNRNPDAHWSNYWVKPISINYEYERYLKKVKLNFHIQ